MADAANAYKERPLERETFAHSIAAMHRWGGKLALAGSEAVDEVYQHGPEAIAYADHTSGLREMIKTDEQYGRQLDFEDRREHAIVDGLACDAEGTPLIDIIARGCESVQLLNDPDMQNQMIRNEGDRLFQERADALLPGQSLFGRSKHPAEALASPARAKYRALGYREDLDILHVLTKTDDGRLIGQTYSVSFADDEAWRALLSNIGHDVPAGISSDEWIQHSFVRDMDAESADTFARMLRQDYYNRIGHTEKRYSVTEYLQANEATIRRLFTLYYRPLVTAVYSGNTGAELQSMADAFIAAAPDTIKKAKLVDLQAVAAGQPMTDTMARTLDEMIRYAVVEELRSGLRQFTTTGLVPVSNVAQLLPELPAAVPQTKNDVSVHYAMLNQRLAGRMSDGVRAGRSYGGCSSTELTEENSGSGLTDAYVLTDKTSFEGKLNFRSRESRIGKKSWKECVVQDCPTRPGKTEVGGCGVCLKRCQKLFDNGVDPTKMKQTESKTIKSQPPRSFSLEQFVTKPSNKAAQKPELAAAA